MLIHDFRFDALGVALPHVSNDIARNDGIVVDPRYALSSLEDNGLYCNCSHCIRPFRIVLSVRVCIVLVTMKMINELRHKPRVGTVNQRRPLPTASKLVKACDKTEHES